MIHSMKRAILAMLWLAQFGSRIFGFQSASLMGFRQHSQAATTIDHRHGKFSTFQLQSIADDVGSPPQPIVALNVILRIKPEVRDEFLKVILNNQQGTMNKELEPLALEYTFGEDASEPNTFHFHEKYIGEEGIAAHNSAPHFLVWEEFAGTDPFTAPPEVYKFVIYQE